MRRLAAAAFALALMAQAPAPGPQAPSGPDAWLPRGTADLVLLDKLRGQPTAVSIKTGETATFGSLSITVRNCAIRPPDLPQNSAAFLDVVDSKGSAPLFRGWVLSNTPSVGQLEHPVYDLRLQSCR